MAAKNKHTEEPRLESVVAWLSDKGGVESIKQDINKLSSTLYFFNPNQLAPLHQMIKQLNEQEYAIVLENIMQLYPLSTPIVLEIIKENTQATNEVLKFYDLENALALAWNTFLNNFDSQSRQNKKLVENYEEKLRLHEQYKAKYIKDIEDLKKAGSKEKALSEELEKLNREYNELAKSFTKEELEKSIIELETKLIEKRKIQEQYAKDKRQIKEIENDLSKIRSENAAYIKSLKSLSDVAKILPDSEVD
jgi:hypothetical protein